MTRKAWIENDKVRDVAPIGADPIFIYGAEIGASYDTDVPDEACHGWVLDGGEWVEPTPPAPSIESQKQTLKSENLAKRLARLEQGFDYTFPGDVDDVIQTRNQTDLGNVNAVSTTAIVLQGQGVTDPVLSFRAQSNTAHSLTPEQAIAMGIATSNFVSSVYANKWRVDDEVIDAASDQAAIDAIDLDAEWSGV